MSGCARIVSAQLLGLMFEDLESADVLDVAEGVAVHGVESVPRYALTMGRTSYFERATSSLNLDRDLSVAPDKGTDLRSALGGDPRSFAEIGRLRAPVSPGAATVVVTADGQLALTVRRKNFVSSAASAGRDPVHVIAEGLTPEDVDAEGFFDPTAGAHRGLREELNVGPGSSAMAARVVPVGVAFDHRRWQPCFVFLAHVDATFEGLVACARTADDAWESDGLLPVPFDVDDPELRDLLLGSHRRLELASNHAAIALWFALVHQHGVEKMVASMRLNSGAHAHDQEVS